MNKALIIAAIVFFIGMVIYLSYYFNARQVIIRKLSKIPHKSLSSIRTNDLVKISGKALHVQEPLLAPLSRRPCIFYKIKIYQKKSSGKHSYWDTIIKEEKFQDFFIEQNGEMAIVRPTNEPKNYQSFLIIDKKSSSGAFDHPTPEFETLLKRYNIDTKGIFGFNKSLRYEEGIIEVGERITVAGVAKWKALKEPIPKYRYSKIMELEQVGKHKLIITDLPASKTDRIA
jgi:hypothetical protein